MTVVYDGPDGRRAYCKGAPEVVAEHARAADPALEELADAWASEGFRVLSVATRSLDPSMPLDDDVEIELELLGLVSRLTTRCDRRRPCRMEQTHHADMPVKCLPATTLQRRGRSATLSVWPTRKSSPGQHLQRSSRSSRWRRRRRGGGEGCPRTSEGERGCRDGPLRHRSCARSGRVVLTDDDFATIVTAMPGRDDGSRDNIRKFVAFLLSANFGEVLSSRSRSSPASVRRSTVVQVLSSTSDRRFARRSPDPDPLRSPDDAIDATRARRPIPRPHQLARPDTHRRPRRPIAPGRVRHWASNRTGGCSDDGLRHLALAELMLVVGIRSPSLAAWRSPSNGWLVSSTLVPPSSWLSRSTSLLRTSSSQPSAFPRPRLRWLSSSPCFHSS